MLWNTLNLFFTARIDGNSSYAEAGPSSDFPQGKLTSLGRLVGQRHAGLTGRWDKLANTVRQAEGQPWQSSAAAQHSRTRGCR